MLDERIQQVMICSSDVDLAAKKQIYDMLKGCGLSVWIESEDLLPGQNREFEVRKVIETAALIIVSFSRKSVDQRGVIQKRYKQILDIFGEFPEGDIFIIPVRLDNCEMPSSFRPLQHVDLNIDNGVEQMLKAINAGLGNKAVLSDLAAEPCLDKSAVLDKDVIKSLRNELKEHEPINLKQKTRVKNGDSYQAGGDIVITNPGMTLC